MPHRHAAPVSRLRRDRVGRGDHQPRDPDAGPRREVEAYKLISSLKEYVLVSQDERRIEVRRRVEHGFRSDVAGADDAVVVHGHELPVRAFYD
jgi:hypothetical protein